MEAYNDEAYREVINEFIQDTYYIEGLSYTTKIEKIRQYTEIILRRLLRFDMDKQLMLGDRAIKSDLKEKGYDEPWFKSSVKKIQKKGNDHTHTEVRYVAGEEEYNTVIDNLFNLYGYLFYVFFKKYKFGSNREIMSKFSLLPPIIRYITLKHLYEIDRNNVDVIDKFVLATVKAKNREEADSWVEEHGTELRMMSICDDEAMKCLITQLGPEIGGQLIASSNMYTLCCQSIAALSRIQELISYDSFETALKGYKEYGHVSGETEDVKEFNQLMVFVFMGRREEEPFVEKLNEKEYLLNNIFVGAEENA